MVLNNITSFVNRVFQPTQTRVVAPIPNSLDNNPFANPFLGSKNNNENIYVKNKPVLGGFFAGYYNGKPNIVGTRLFLEV